MSYKGLTQQEAEDKALEYGFDGLRVILAEGRFEPIMEEVCTMLDVIIQNARVVAYKSSKEKFWYQ